MNIHDVVREMNLPEIRIKKSNIAPYYILSGVGSEVLAGVNGLEIGMHFSEQEAVLIAAALNNIRSDICGARYTGTAAMNPQNPAFQIKFKEPITVGPEDTVKIDVYQGAVRIVVEYKHGFGHTQSVDAEIVYGETG